MARVGRPIGHFPVFRRPRWPPHGPGRGRCYSRACLEACLTVAHLSCELRQLKAGARSDGRQVKDVRVILCFVVEKEKQLSLSTCVLNYVLFSELSVDAAPIAVSATSRAVPWRQA